jgi:hypothetical protein
MTALPAIPSLPRDHDVRERLAAFFLSTPVTAVPAGLLALLMALSSIVPLSIMVYWSFRKSFIPYDYVPREAGLAAIGVLLLCVAIFYLSYPSDLKELRAADKEIDAVLRSDLQILADRGFGKLQFHRKDGANRGELVVGSPRIITAGLNEVISARGVTLTAAQVRGACGTDGRWRHRLYQMTALFHGQHHLGYYTCRFNLETGHVLDEHIYEVNYKDIVSIQTELYCQGFPKVAVFPVILGRWLANFDVTRLWRQPEEKPPLPPPLAYPLSSSFTVHLAGGQHLMVPYVVQKNDIAGEFDAAEEEIARLRLLLREKRQAAVRILEE